MKYNAKSTLSLNHFNDLCKNVLQFVVHLNLQPLNDGSDDEDTLPSLKQPHLCCPPKMTVHHLCKVICLQYLESGTIMHFSYFSLAFPSVEGTRLGLKVRNWNNLTQFPEVVAPRVRTHFNL